MACLVGFSPRVMRVLHDRSLRSALANVREQSSLGADSTVESETRPCSRWKKEGEIRGNTRAFFFPPLSFVFDDEHTLFIEIVQRWFSVILDVCDTRGGILLRSLGKKERNELVDLSVRCYLMRFCTFFSVFSILSPLFSFRSFHVRSRTASFPC